MKKQAPIIVSKSDKKSLKDFTRLGLAFFGGLLLISCYQQIRLYFQGTLDSFFSANLILSGLHQLGYAAILALFLSFVFNVLETRKPKCGERFVAVLFLGLLGVEFLLTEYFVTQYVVPVPGNHGSYTRPPGIFALRLILGFSILSGVFYVIYKRSAGLQLWIGRMYPFTIVLFSMFLATLLSEKRPVNQNKTELVLATWFNQTKPAEAIKPALHPRFGIPRVSARDRVWVDGIFSGSDFDKAYQIARNLAHNGAREEALRLTSHILWEVPGHVDAAILMGRLLAWEESFDGSAAILEGVVRKNPGYEDAYAALLDTYFWAGEHQKALQMQPVIEKHLGASSLLEAKLERSRAVLTKSDVTMTQADSERNMTFPDSKNE